MLDIEVKNKKMIKIQSKQSLTMFIVMGLLIAGYILAPIVSATHLNEQIDDLNQENAETRQQDALLEIEEKNIEETVSRIQGDISAVEEQIRLNKAKYDDTLAQIAKAEEELDKQKGLLGKNIKAMYLEGEISTIEMLATSNDLSDFLDKEQYRKVMQNNIKVALDKVTALKSVLAVQKESLERLLLDQQTMQSQLASQRAEQNRLLGLNQQQQTEFENIQAENNRTIAELRRKQIAENTRFFGNGSRKNIPDTTGYPWANVRFPNAIADPWGMYQRQCVSYTAWKVWKSGRNMPYWGGRGNANLWDDNARAAGIPVDSNPRVGDVAVSNSGYYGHVMYVESVYDDGTIYVSQYNAGWDGLYSEARISAKGLVFIHF